MAAIHKWLLRYIGEASSKTSRLQREDLKRQKQFLKEMQKQVGSVPDKQVSLANPDARSMATNGKGTGMRAARRGRPQKPVQQYLRGYGRISTARNLSEEAGEVAGLELDIIRKRRRPL